MFDIAPSEFLLVAFIALVVIGPKDLPKAMRVVGYWVGKARGVARQFRSGFDEMVRESELAEMEKKWAEENARIMREHPAQPPAVIDAEPTDAPHDSPVLVKDDVEHATSPHDEPHPVMVEKPVVVPMDDGHAVKTADDAGKAPS